MSCSLKDLMLYLCVCAALVGFVILCILIRTNNRSEVVNLYEASCDGRDMEYLVEMNVCRDSSGVLHHVIVGGDGEL